MYFVELGHLAVAFADLVDCFAMLADVEVVNERRFAFLGHPS
jgi:hypothetical protein